MNQAIQQRWEIGDEGGDTYIQRETQYIKIPEDAINKIFSQAVKNNTEALLAKIALLEKQVNALQKEGELQVTNEEAKKIVVHVLGELKKEGVDEVSIITLHTRTHLAVDQISYVMCQLEDEGFVREDGEGES